MNIALLAIQQLPAVLQMIKDAHTTANPTLPPLTDAEVMAALQSAITSSIAKDDLYLSVHPA